MINAQLNQRLMVRKKIGHYMYHAVSSLHCNVKSILTFVSGQVGNDLFFSWAFLEDLIVESDESLLLLEVPL